jgi:hypothetical protein
MTCFHHWNLSNGFMRGATNSFDWQAPVGHEVIASGEIVHNLGAMEEFVHALMWQPVMTKIVAQEQRKRGECEAVGAQSKIAIRAAE